MIYDEQMEVYKHIHLTVHNCMGGALVAKNEAKIKMSQSFYTLFERKNQRYKKER